MAAPLFCQAALVVPAVNAGQSRSRRCWCCWSCWHHKLTVCCEPTARVSEGRLQPWLESNERDGSEEGVCCEVSQEQ